LYQNYHGWNGSDGMILDGMVQVERLVSCTDRLYEMIHNFVWFDELVSISMRFLEYSKHISRIWVHPKQCGATIFDV
jgi:hypothetical protein